MEPFLKRTWAEIDLDRIKQNFLNIKNFVSKDSKMMCVLKADAYGHGATVLAKEYEKLGADFFAVSNLEEAFQLRFSGITTKILILGYTPVNMVKHLAAFNISQTVFSSSYAQKIAKSAKEQNVKINIHLKIDTGMSRIGFVFNDIQDETVVDEITKISQEKNLVLEGIFTHFYMADEEKQGKKITENQFDNFIYLREKLREKGITFKLSHASNSAGIVNYKEMNLDMVRAGIALYGLYPSEYKKNDLNLLPAMSLKTVISQVKTVDKGAKVSYGGNYTAKNKTKIATVPIGYADGYLRDFSSNAYMLVKGKRVPVIGNVCMDQLMLNISLVEDAREDDEVLVFGESKDGKILIEELAKRSNTITYELITLVSKRVPRIYIKNKKEVNILNYICP